MRRAGRGRAAGGGLELGEGAVDGVALPQPRHRRQGAQPDDQRQRPRRPRAAAAGRSCRRCRGRPGPPPTRPRSGRRACGRACRRRTAARGRPPAAPVTPRTRRAASSISMPCRLQQPRHHRQQPGQPRGRRLGGGSADTARSSGAPPVGGEGALEAADDGLAQLRRLLDQDVGSEAGDLVGERLGVGEVDVHQRTSRRRSRRPCGRRRRRVCPAPVRTRSTDGCRSRSATRRLHHRSRLVVGRHVVRPVPAVAVRTAPSIRLSRNTRGRAAVGVEAGEVPAAVPGRDPPRLHVPLATCAASGGAVGEADRPAVHARRS